MIRLRDDQVGDDDLEAFAEWLGQTPAHAEAFADAEQLFKDMVLAAGDPAPSASNSVAPPKTAQTVPLTKRLRQVGMQRWLAPAIAIAAAWLVAVGLVMPKQAHLLSDYLSDYRTQTGELREVQLSDGSRLLLNTNSAISVDFSSNARQIVLHHGQVRFTVAKDAQRPFEVVADDLKIRALGTIFDVYKNGHAQTRVIVQEHAVAATLIGNGPEPAGVKIRQGQQLNVQAGQPLPQPEPATLEQATSWQQRRLVINDRPLIELLAELERYRLGRIFVGDASLNQLRVSGVFSLDDPESALRTLRQALALKETRIGPWWVVLHR
ncbi:hypothetical protein AYM39_00315 [Methylomonas sp. DH-1]|nr:hypothetical protein AYM39_00315 [Methylomonas sp. DH-1]